MNVMLVYNGKSIFVIFRYFSHESEFLIRNILVFIILVIYDVRSRIYLKNVAKI